MNRGRQHDLDDKGIAKTAREEKAAPATQALKQKTKNEKMKRLYREHVLGEKKVEGFVPLDGLLGTVTKHGSNAGVATATPAVTEKREEVGAMGD